MCLKENSGAVARGSEGEVERERERKDEGRRRVFFFFLFFISLLALFCATLKKEKKSSLVSPLFLSSFNKPNAMRSLVRLGLSALRVCFGRESLDKGGASKERVDGFFSPRRSMLDLKKKR